MSGTKFSLSLCTCGTGGQPAAASLWQAWIKPLTPDFLFWFAHPLLLTDTAAKLQAVKDKARQANDTAKDVLAQIKDLHQNLDGLKKNYNQLADSVAKTNAVIKDPSKNSKISFSTLCLLFLHTIEYPRLLTVRLEETIIVT